MFSIGLQSRGMTVPGDTNEDSRHGKIYGGGDG
jgi:hypothetical protein